MTFVARPIYIRGEDEDDSAYVPHWVPELTVGTRADVYPVEVVPSLPELVLDEPAVTHGYSERKVAYEFASCITGNPEPLRSSAGPAPPTISGDALSRMLGKVKVGITQLKRSRPTKLQRVHLPQIHSSHNNISSSPNNNAAHNDSNANPSNRNPHAEKRALFPFQKPLANSSLDNWFNRLSEGGSFSTSDLCEAVPLGPAIVRAAGKVLEMLAVRNVPTQRAVWYIRIAVLNECVKQVRPDRPPPSPRIFWTKQLCNLLKLEIDAIRVKKSVSASNMDRAKFWDYVFDIARWQIDEDLLDNINFLLQITKILKLEIMAAKNLNSKSSKIILLAVQRFLPNLLTSRQLRSALREALLPASAHILSVVSASGSGSNNRRSSNRANSIQTLTETNSQPVFNKACLMIAGLLGNVGNENIALRRLNAFPPKKFTSEILVDKAFEIVTTNEVIPDTPPFKPHNTARGAAGAKSNARMDKLWDSSIDLLSPLDVTAALERFPATGNSHTLRLIMHGAFANKGGDRAAVEHVCKWALSAKSFFLSHVVATAAAAIEILQFSNGNQKKASGTQNSPDKNNTANRKVQTGTPPFHREIWTFLKELGEDEDREEEKEDDRIVVALIARLCKVGVFSLSAFVRDVARIPACNSRLVTYVQLLPEPHEKTSADARRALLRRHGMLPSAKDQANQTIMLERILDCIHNGKEIEAILEGAKLKKMSAIGNPGMQLAVAESVVQEITELLKKHPEKVATGLRSTISFLKAAGTGGLAVDLLSNCICRLLHATSQSKGPRTEGIYAGINVAVDCLPHLAPLLAATNQLPATISLLVRVWNVAVGSAAQKRIRDSAEQTALMIGKYFCAAAPTEHDQWKQLVLGALPVSSFASMKTLFCGLVAGVQPAFLEEQQSLASVQAFLNKSTKIVRASTKPTRAAKNDKIWMHQGIDTILPEKKMHLRNTVIKPIGADVDKFYTQLTCVNHIAEGLILPVLRVSDKLQQMSKAKNDACKTGMDNITHILCSHWMQALGDEMRPYTFIEIMALLLFASMRNFSGARDALQKITQLDWARKVVSLHAGKGFFERFYAIVKIYLAAVAPPNNGAAEENESVIAQVCNTIVLLSGNGAEIEANGIVSGIGMKPGGVTQMLFCAALTLGNVKGTSDDFAAKAANVIVACNSDAETSVLARMLLKCYNGDDDRAAAAHDIANCAAQAMEESLRFFVTGITADSSEINPDNELLANAWKGADEARKAMLVVTIMCLENSHKALIVGLLCTQIEQLGEKLLSAAENRCIPRNASPAGTGMADTIEARVNILLKLTRAAANEVDTVRIAKSGGRLLRAAAYLMKDSTIDTVIELIRIAIALRNGEAKKKKGLCIEIRNDVAAIQPLLEKHQWEAVQRATGGTKGAHNNNNNNSTHAPVVARGGDGEIVDNWYLLEGYGRGAEEEAAVPPRAFNQQGNKKYNNADGEITTANNNKHATVRLKRTYSTFACLVR